MFGCVVAGRLLQTNLTQIDETHALFELPAAGAINHVSVFLLGSVLFPDGFGATVHFHWPGKGFQLLGMLSNEKPSAIFRLRGTFTPSSTSNSFAAPTPTSAFSPTPAAAAGDVTAILGFSIEPLPQIHAQIAALPASVSSNTIGSNSNSAISAAARPGADATLLAEKIVKNLFNYVSGFVPDASSVMRGVTPDVMLPMGVIAKWYEKFIGKVRAGGVGFLENEE